MVTEELILLMYTLTFNFLDMKNIELVVDKSKIKKIAMYDELSSDSIYFENKWGNSPRE